MVLQVILGTSSDGSSSVAAPSWNRRISYTVARTGIGYTPSHWERCVSGWTWLPGIFDGTEWNCKRWPEVGAWLLSRLWHCWQSASVMPSTSYPSSKTVPPTKHARCNQRRWRLRWWRRQKMCSKRPLSEMVNRR